MHEIKRNIENILESYIQGNLSVEDVESSIKQVYSDMRDYCISSGLTNGNHSEFNEKIMKDTFTYFTFYAAGNTNRANGLEGIEYASAAGYMPSKTAYYNSKYYYDFEALKSACFNASNDLSKEFGFSFNAQSVYDNMPMCNSFSENWKLSYSDVCSMIDLSAPPPQDFKMFYAADLYSREARQNATTYYLSADNPAFGSTSNLSGCDYAILVPQGASLLKSTAFEALIGFLARGSTKLNITPYLHNSGLNDNAFQSAFSDLVQSLINNFYNGKISITSNGEQHDYDIPFDDFGAPKEYYGSQVVPSTDYGGFVNNFVFNRV